MTSYKHKMRLAALSTALSVVVLAGCSTYNGLTSRIAQHITPYRVTIVQGNFVSSDQAAKLRVGMSRDEVRTTLGTPLLTDMFHPERWDYIFYFKRGSTAVVEQRDLVVNFNGDTVVSWSGAEDLPSNQDLIAMIDGSRSESNLLKERDSAKRDAAKARAEDASAKAAVPASNAVAPNQRAADSANNALAAAAASPTTTTRSVPQSSVQATPEPQFHLTTPNHLRPAGGDSVLARPPGADDAPASSAAVSQ